MDHSVIDISQSRISCGVVELSRLSDDQERNAFALATQFYHPSRGDPPAFVIWSNLSEGETNGSRFLEFMGGRFGKSTCTDAALNPKTGNMIKMWSLQIDHEPFKAWWKEQKIARIKKS